MWRHLEQADPQSQPTMAAYSKLSWEQMWSQPVDQQVEDVFAYYSEQGPLILADIEAYVGQEPIVMEGAAFLPTLVHAWGVPPGQALFLVPTKAFQVANYSQREWVKPILDSCADPEQAFSKWMERDHRFGQGVTQQAQAMGYCTITVDGQLDIDSIYAAVIEHFSLPEA